MTSKNSLPLIGDILFLKSGSPRLKVLAHIGEEKVRLQIEGTEKSTELHVACLTKVQPEWDQNEVMSEEKES